MVRIPTLTIPSLVFAVACTACSPSSKPGQLPGDPGGGPPPGGPTGPGTLSPGTSNERPEVDLTLHDGHGLDDIGRGSAMSSLSV